MILFFLSRAKEIRISFKLIGGGTTNDGESFFLGNTVRRMFRDLKFLAAQIGASDELVLSMFGLPSKKIWFYALRNSMIIAKP